MDRLLDAGLGVAQGVQVGEHARLLAGVPHDGVAQAADAAVGSPRLGEGLDRRLLKRPAQGLAPDPLDQ